MSTRLKKSEKNCPIISTHDKFEEAHYFLHKMIDTYHFPTNFRYNLNAFLQALRNITFMLQSEKNKPENFEEWYAKKQSKMQKSRILRKMVKGRNILVKKSMLKFRSKVGEGLFRGRQYKLLFDSNCSPFMSSEELLEITKKAMIGWLIDKEHSEIGEQLGIERTWVVSEISRNEIVGVCYEALWDMFEIVKEAHGLYNFRLENDELNCLNNFEEQRVLLETDLDPTLIRKWKW